MVRSAESLPVYETGRRSDLSPDRASLHNSTLKDHTQAGKEKFEDVKNQLQLQLQKDKTNQLRAALDKKLKQNARIEVLMALV